MSRSSATLLIDCPDRPGLVAAIANFLLQHGANILHADQHQDAESGLFFMRVEWTLDGFDLDEPEFRQRFEPVASEHDMRWRLAWGNAPMRTAIFVSRQLHCLSDLLARSEVGDLECDIRLIISNHEDARRLADFHGIPFYCIPVTPETRHDAEALQRRMLAEEGIELVVLARYMQILSTEFTADWPSAIINVHHGFLPAFPGARPYHRAHARGVKLIGATAHYATEVLDDGPIIEQDVLRISHRDSVDDLVRKGRDLEKLTLSRAVRWHARHRVLTYANKTVVFD